MASQVLLLHQIIQFIEDGGHLATGILLSVALGVCSVVQTIAQSLFFISSSRGALRVSTAMSVVVFKKAMRLSMSSSQNVANTSGGGGGRAGSGSGVSPINLAQNDAKRVYEGLVFFHFAWSAFFEVGVVIIFLLLQIGISGLAGIGAVFLLIPLQVVFAKAIGARCVQGPRPMPRTLRITVAPV